MSHDCAGDTPERGGCPVSEAGVDERRRQAPRVDLVLPVHNEEQQLPWSVLRVAEVTRALSGWDWTLVLVDNASTDGTWSMAEEMSCRVPGVRGVRLPRKGRGGALRAAWSQSTADFMAYMDVDLSTDLRHLADAIGCLSLGRAEIVTGSRLMPGSRVRRGWRREVLSRGFNGLARLMTGSGLCDHQCGFKAITRSAAADLLPRVESDGWFFDTELLVLAQRRNWRIEEIPVAWRDDPGSSVRILPTVMEDLRGLWRLRRWRRGA